MLTRCFKTLSRMRRIDGDLQTRQAQFTAMDVAAGTFAGGAGTVLAGKTPLGRLGRVTDIAPLAVFLASDESAWISGEVIRAAGGLVVAT